VPRGFDGCFGHWLAKQAIARDVQHVARLHPRRVDLGPLEQRGDAPVRGHRPLAVGVAKRDDHATTAGRDRSADFDAVARELGGGEFARDVVAPLADQPARGAESTGPRGHVRRLTAGGEADRGRRIGIRRERPLWQYDDVEDQIADRADRPRRRLVSGSAHADMITPGAARWLSARSLGFAATGCVGEVGRPVRSTPNSSSGGRR
jgi:hypothetical protein